MWLTRAALRAVWERWGQTLARHAVLGSGRVRRVGPISIRTIRLFPTLSYVVYHLKPTTVLRTSSTCRIITTYLNELAEGIVLYCGALGLPFLDRHVWRCDLLDPLRRNYCRAHRHRDPARVPDSC